MSPGLVQGAAALAVVGALLGARRLLGQRTATSAMRALEVRERCGLSREAGLLVVRWGGRELLVGYGTSSVTLLAASEREVQP